MYPADKKKTSFNWCHSTPLFGPSFGPSSKTATFGTKSFGEPPTTTTPSKSFESLELTTPSTSLQTTETQMTSLPEDIIEYPLNKKKQQNVITFNSKIIRLNKNNEKFKSLNFSELSNLTFDFLKFAPFAFHQDLKLDDFSSMYLSFLRILIIEEYDTKETIFNQALKLIVKFNLGEDPRTLFFTEAVLIFLNNENNIPSVLEKISRKSLVTKKIITDMLISSYNCDLKKFYFFWDPCIHNF